MKKFALKELTWFALAFGLLAISCTKNAPIQYLDSELPGLTPELYAEGIINLPDRFQQNLTMTADGSEHYFTETNGDEWRYLQILRVTMEDSNAVVTAPQFSKDFQFANERFIGEPMLSADGQQLVFVADYPPNLWLSQREAAGNWGAPNKMDVSTEKADWYPSFQRDGTLLFTNGIAYISKPSANREKEELALPTYPFDVRDPVFAPDNDYLIVTRLKNQKDGETDLFVSFSQEDGSWGTLMDLGPAINTEGYEFGPTISPDGKFLFFSRRDEWQNAKFSNIYWVSTLLVDSLQQVSAVN